MKSKLYVKMLSNGTYKVLKMIDLVDYRINEVLGKIEVAELATGSKCTVTIT